MLAPSIHHVINICTATLQSWTLKGSGHILHTEQHNFVLEGGKCRDLLGLTAKFNKSNFITYLAFPTLSTQSSTGGSPKVVMYSTQCHVLF